MAWGDDTWALHAVWRDWFDATLMTYRNNPAQRLVNQTGRYWDVGGPTANVRKAPLGQQLRVQDAAWCASGLLYIDDGNTGHCVTRHLTSMVLPLSDGLVAAVSVLTPNEHEVEQLTGQRASDAQELALAAKALHNLGVSDVLITLGARGVFASGVGFSELVPGFAVEAVDTTAAGDVFNGALAVSLVEGQALREAVQFANAAAALSVMRVGAQASAPRRDEIEAFVATVVAASS